MRLLSGLFYRHILFFFDPFKFLKSFSDSLKVLRNISLSNLVWEKFLEMVRKVKGVIKESTMKVLIKYKPEILDAVLHLKNVIIACGGYNSNF